MRCLRAWQRSSMAARGREEDTCRVCHQPFQLPPLPATERLALWFSPSAPDRVSVWATALSNVLAATLVPLGEPRLRGLEDLCLLATASEVRVLCLRELRRGSPVLILLRHVIVLYTRTQNFALGCFVAGMVSCAAGDALANEGEGRAAPKRSALSTAVTRTLRELLPGALRLPLHIVLRFGEPLHRLCCFVQRFPSFQL